MSFMDLLRNRTELILFAEYLREQRAEESLEFWISVELYRLLPSSAERIYAARNIFNKFLKRLSPREINVDGEMKEKVVERMENFNIDATLFDDLQFAVFELLEYDCYSRFQAAKRVRSPSSDRMSMPEKLSRSPKQVATTSAAIDPEMIQYLNSLKKEEEGPRGIRILPKSVVNFLFPEQAALARSRSSPDHLPAASERRRSVSISSPKSPRASDRVTASSEGGNGITNPRHGLIRNATCGTDSVMLSSEVQLGLHRSPSEMVSPPRKKRAPGLIRMTARHSVSNLNLLKYDAPAQHCHKPCSAPVLKSSGSVRT